MVNIGIKLFDSSLYPVGDVTSIQGAEVVITTIADNQRIAEVELFLLPEDKSIQAPFIGKFTIRDIPESKAGEPRYTLIIKADNLNNLNVLVYDRGKLSGKMDIPVTGWHPEHKTETISHVVMNKSNDETFKRDFEVHYKSERDTHPPKKTDTGDKPYSAAVPREEKIHTIPTHTQHEKPAEKSTPTTTGVPGGTSATTTTKSTLTQAATTPRHESDEKKSPVRAILLTIAMIALLALIVVLAVVRPWQTRDGGSPLVSPSEGPVGPDEDTASIEQPATPEPAEDPSVTFAAFNAQINALGNIYFEPDTTVLRPGSDRTIDTLAGLLAPMKGKLSLEVTGHTAKWGTQEEQYELSVKRAELIVSELARRDAIDPKNATARGVGATIPATSDAGKIDLNRRVEFKAVLVAPAP